MDATHTPERVRDRSSSAAGRPAWPSDTSWRSRDRSFVILDAGDRIGDSWRNRWGGLRLFTRARYDGLPGMPFPAAPNAFPTKDEVADYLESYADRMSLPVRTGIRRRRASGATIAGDGSS